MASLAISLIKQYFAGPYFFDFKICFRYFSSENTVSRAPYFFEGPLLQKVIHSLYCMYSLRQNS